MKIELPFNFGDSLFTLEAVYGFCENAPTLIEVVEHKNAIHSITLAQEGNGFRWTVNLDSLSGIKGKFFFSREEAEAAVRLAHPDCIMLDGKWKDAAIFEPNGEKSIRMVECSIEALKSDAKTYKLETMPMDKNGYFIVHDANGRENGKPLSRAIYGPNGKLIDAVYGTFGLFKTAEVDGRRVIVDFEEPAEKPAGNTRIEFLYRDASNYKVHNSCVINGRLLEEQISQIMGSLKDDVYFIPAMVGLDGERFSDENEDDGPFFELYESGFEVTDEKPTTKITPEELTRLFIEADAIGWIEGRFSVSGPISIRLADLESILSNCADDHTDEEKREMKAELVWLWEISDLWDEFGDVPMNPETECIETDWCIFKAGTHREDIWHWFEEKFGISVAENLMGF